jgi:hypothetical protein
VESAPIDQLRAVGSGVLCPWRLSAGSFLLADAALKGLSSGHPPDAGGVPGSIPDKNLE